MTTYALAYVSARRWKRRVRLWPLIGLLAGVALLAGLQALALRRVDAQGTLDPAVLDPFLRFAPLLLPALLLMSTFSTPLRLEVAEVSWVLTAPGGTRALLTRALLLRPVGYAAIGFLGASLARSVSGRPLQDVWKVALVGAVIGLVMRLLVFGAHLLVVRARAAVALRALALAWGGTLLASAFTDLPGGSALGLRPVLERMVAVALDPAGTSAIWLLVMLAVLLTATVVLVATARGFEEPAQALARQIAEAQEALRRSPSGEQIAKPLRRKVRSLSGLSARSGWSPAGERALLYRGLAQQRRLVLPSLVVLGLLLDLGVPLVLLDVAPTFAWAWTVVVLVGAIWGAGAQLAVELEHYHLRLAPLRPLRALLWLSAVPALHRLVSMELAWFPVLFAPRVSSATWAVGVVLIPCLVALVEATGSLAVALSSRLLARAGLKAALAMFGVVPATAIAVGTTSLGWPASLVAPAAAAALLASVALSLTRTVDNVWPKEIR